MERAAVLQMLGGAAMLCVVNAAPPPEIAVEATRIVVGAARRAVVISRPVVWSAARTYEIASRVVVAEGGTLTIEPGTRIEARPGASIEVARDGRIIAEGTPLQPIVMTCTSATKYEGCWGGLTIRGFGRINFGAATSPPVRGTGAAGCNETESGAIAFGGCADNDSSGVIRYLRVEYAASGLRLLGIGSATRIDFVQVNRSRENGMTIEGGAVDVRHLFLTANNSYGLAWRGGWRGRGQFITVQQDRLNNTGGISGSNIGGSTGSFGATPRSAPLLYNITIIAPSDPANPGHSAGPSAVHLVGGTSGVLRNVFVFASAIGLDVDNAQTCLDFNGVSAVSFTHAVIAGTALTGSSDSDPFLCSTYSDPSIESEWLTDPANASVVVTDPAVVASILRNGTDMIVPDLRPAGNSAPATYAAAIPPLDGFFDAGATFAGAVAPTTPVRNIVPWYSGWTTSAPAPPLPGSASGIVASAVRGPIEGASVAASFGATATTTAGGSYTLALPAGDHMLTTSSLPVGCGAAPRAVTVTSGAAVSANIDVNCVVATDVAAGALHGCTRLSDGRLQCWGQNDFGMVGDGTLISPRLSPEWVSGNLAFTLGTLTSGYTHTCALRSGAPLCWGLNFFGALGLGTSGFAAVGPVPAGNSSTPSFVALSAGGYHTCALTAAGVAWCWGWNLEGQIGNGAMSFAETTPVAVASGSVRFTRIAAGESHTCALTAQGEAYCWGGNGRGELGSDPAIVGTKSLVPIPVSGGHTFAAIDAGTQHTCGITTSGEALCWGARDKGQLGDGVVGGLSASPVPVSTAERFTQLSAGGQTTCGLTLAQHLLCWGAGTSGVLGNATQTSTQAVPVSVSTALLFQSVAVNLSDSTHAVACGVTVAGDVFCWGAGGSGQLGTGSATPSSSVPVQVRIRGV